MNNQIRTSTAVDSPVAHDQLPAILAARPELPRPRPQRFIIRSGPRITIVDVRQIDWIQAEGNYVRLHVGDESHLIRHTMHAVEERLGDLFVRIHRSRIANMQNVRELRMAANGEYEVVLRSGGTLRVSRLYRARVQDRLRQP